MSIEAFILIGGRSSRLGRDKALVQLGARTLAERALATVRNSHVASKIFFVAGDETQFAIEAIRLDALFVFDLIEGRGPLGGIHSALSNATTEWILVLACDYPLVTPELLKFLSKKISDEFGVIVPEQPDGRLQPLCAFYNVKKSLPVIDEIIHRPRASPPMQEVVNLLNPRIVKPAKYALTAREPQTLFLNINTEEDLKTVRQIVRED